MSPLGGDCPTTGSLLVSVGFVALLVGFGLYQVRVPIPLSPSGDDRPLRPALVDRLVADETGYRQGMTTSDLYGYLAIAIGVLGAGSVVVRVVTGCL